MRLRFLLLLPLLLAPFAAQGQAAPGSPALAGAVAGAHPRAGDVGFVAGSVVVFRDGAEHALRAGDVVYEGDRFATGAGGHLHVKTVDGGFLALRPDSRAHIEIYRYDPAAPAQTRIRLVLDSGVMRSVSGTGAQAARDKFRLNTPVAAIGIRGTDFTVSTTDALTRAVVRKGAIVVSPFDATCRPEALGPCAGDAVRLLSGDEAGKLLELRRGQRAPVLIDLRPNGGAPDQVSPPAGSEPQASSAPERGGASPASQLGQQASALSTEARLGDELNAVARNAPGGGTAGAGGGGGAGGPGSPGGSTPPATPPVPIVTWGRWAAVAGLPAGTPLEAFIGQFGPMATINQLYVLSVANAADLHMPDTGTYAFALDRAEAWTTDRGAISGPAAVQGGQLSVNFGQQRFSTSLDVNAMGTAATLRSQGRLTADGMLSGALIYSDPSINMNVRGALGGATGTTAGYLFDAMLGPTRGIVGATSWSR